MGKVGAVIPAELEMRLRRKDFERMGGKRGGLSEIVTEALQLWFKQHEKDK